MVGFASALREFCYARITYNATKTTHDNATKTTHVTQLECQTMIAEIISASVMSVGQHSKICIVGRSPLRWVRILAQILASVLGVFSCSFLGCRVCFVGL
jgi:hypothetical protein